MSRRGFPPNSSPVMSEKGEEEAVGNSEPPPNQDEDKESEFVEMDPTGRYGRYCEVLGKGAFKTVYRAFDEVDGIEVAWNQVKVQDVLQNPEDLERLYSEVHLLKTLKHKNIIKFYASWVDTKTKNVNFITEIFTSGTLRQYRKKHKHVDLKAVKSWSRQILRGLLYLHSHDPPIIHRDLKCDNIFVNGNQGEVKIGDLGLAAILRQAHAAHSVIGTPEFMAPELYEEEYNELVDIYSFGMCLLEMVTFEYPYSECTNAAQIYKKVTSGKKPAALDKVKDPDVRTFVEKCLATANKRLPARDLLMDPFLQIDKPENEPNDMLLPISRSESQADLEMVPGRPSARSSLTDVVERQARVSRADEEPQLRVLDVPQLKGDLETLSQKPKLSPSLAPGHSQHRGDAARQALEEVHEDSNNLGGDKPSRSDERGSRGQAIEEEKEEATAESTDAHRASTSSQEGERPVSRGSGDLPRSTTRDFRVKGKLRDDDTIYLRLRIADHDGHVRNIHFPFDTEIDTAHSVASEMVSELDLSNQDVETIASMIDAEVQALVPEWKHAGKRSVSGEEGLAKRRQGSASEHMDAPEGSLDLHNDYEPLTYDTSQDPGDGIDFHAPHGTAPQSPNLASPRFKTTEDENHSRFEEVQSGSSHQEMDGFSSDSSAERRRKIVHALLGEVSPGRVRSPGRPGGRILLIEDEQDDSCAFRPPSTRRISPPGSRGTSPFRSSAISPLHSRTPTPQGSRAATPVQSRSGSPPGGQSQQLTPPGGLVSPKREGPRPSSPTGRPPRSGTSSPKGNANARMSYSEVVKSEKNEESDEVDTNLADFNKWVESQRAEGHAPYLHDSWRDVPRVGAEDLEVRSVPPRSPIKPVVIEQRRSALDLPQLSVDVQSEPANRVPEEGDDEDAITLREMEELARRHEQEMQELQRKHEEALRMVRQKHRRERSRTDIIGPESQVPSQVSSPDGRRGDPYRGRLESPNRSRTDLSQPPRPASVNGLVSEGVTFRALTPPLENTFSRGQLFRRTSSGLLASEEEPEDTEVAKLYMKEMIAPLAKFKMASGETSPYRTGRRAASDADMAYPRPRRDSDLDQHIHRWEEQNLSEGGSSRRSSVEPDNPYLLGGAYRPEGGAYRPEGGAYRPEGGSNRPEGGSFRPEGGSLYARREVEPPPRRISSHDSLNYSEQRRESADQSSRGGDFSGVRDFQGGRDFADARKESAEGRPRESLEVRRESAGGSVGGGNELPAPTRREVSRRASDESSSVKGVLRRESGLEQGPPRRESAPEAVGSRPDVPRADVMHARRESVESVKSDLEHLPPRRRESEGERNRKEFEGVKGKELSGEIGPVRPEAVGLPPVRRGDVRRDLLEGGLGARRESMNDLGYKLQTKWAEDLKERESGSKSPVSAKYGDETEQARREQSRMQILELEAKALEGLNGFKNGILPSGMSKSAASGKLLPKPARDDSHKSNSADSKG